MKMFLATLITLSSISAFAGNVNMGTSEFDFAEGGKPVVGAIGEITVFGANPSIALNEALLYVQGGNNASCSISETVVKQLGMDLGQLAMLLQTGNFNIYCVNDPNNGMNTTQILEISQ